MMLADDEITSTEDLRLAMAPAGELALAAGDPERGEAKIALGLETRAQPDGVPSCDWCGRSDPPGGLADMRQALDPGQAPRAELTHLPWVDHASDMQCH